MDPNQTFLEMFDAMKSGDLETARERALTLKQWFHNGGFCPYQHTSEAMQDYVASVLRRTAGHGPDPLCALTCSICHADGQFPNEEETMNAGVDRDSCDARVAPNELYRTLPGLPEAANRITNSEKMTSDDRSKPVVGQFLSRGASKAPRDACAKFFSLQSSTTRLAWYDAVWPTSIWSIR